MGWSFDDNMKVSMVKEALNMAHNNCKYQHQSIVVSAGCCDVERTYRWARLAVTIYTVLQEMKMLLSLVIFQFMQAGLGGQM